MATATYNGKIIADTDAYESVEGGVYFPPSSLKMEYFTPTDHTTVCGWKGTANYYTITVDGKTGANAAWVYKTPKDAAANIKEHVAFYTSKGVTVEKKKEVTETVIPDGAMC
eukprot:TRINITY_DN12738_c0_g1_i1.p1 TRINITY_DN12738_c0_g1~~TRINITY_DN12738_c0_g1_i1.p1  ORF type:complete len:122 (+),score=39.56 TRINITY_DN12738_c0_g1_i1:31-366(+)